MERIRVSGFRPARDRTRPRMDRIPATSAASFAKGRSMRIAYVITRADAVGGATIHVRDIASAMRDRGHETVVLVGGEGPVTEQFAAAGVPFQPLRHLRRSANPVRDAMAFPELTATLPPFPPD